MLLRFKEEMENGKSLYFIDDFKWTEDVSKISYRKSSIFFRCVRFFEETRLSGLQKTVPSRHILGPLYLESIKQ